MESRSLPARTTLIASAIGLVVALALGGWALWDWAGLATAELRLSPDAIERFIQEWGAWSAAASIVLMVLHSFLPFPAELIAMANGMLFGPVWGTLLTWSGAMIGGGLAFGLARRLGRPFVRRMLPPGRWSALEGWTADYGTVALLIGRVIPVISFNLINYAAGLAGVRWPVFLWTTGLGILPVTVLSVAIGDRLVKGSPWVWTLVALGAGALWFAVHRLRRRRAGKPAG